MYSDPFEEYREIKKIQSPQHSGEKNETLSSGVSDSKKNPKNLAISIPQKEDDREDLTEDGNTTLRCIRKEQSVLIDFPSPVFSFANKGRVNKKSSFAPDSGCDTPVMKNKKPRLRILSLDGGGVRGIMQIYFLRELEQKTGKSITDMFHVIAGTSIGGILAGLLTMRDKRKTSQSKSIMVEPNNKESESHAKSKKVSFMDMLKKVSDDENRESVKKPRFDTNFLYDFFKQNSKKMFGKKTWNCLGICGNKYDSKPLESVLTNICKDATLNESIVDTLITTFDTKMRSSKVFESYEHNENVVLSDLLMATSAAPTYFGGRIVKTIGSKKECREYHLVDGGMCLNNPTEEALTRASYLYPGVDEFEVLSLGTGMSNEPMDYAKLMQGGKLQWGNAAVDAIISGSSNDTHLRVQQYLKGRGYYTRINPFLSQKHLSMDNTSVENIRDLETAQENLMRSDQNIIEELAKRLKRPKGELLKRRLSLSDKEALEERT